MNRAEAWNEQLKRTEAYARQIERLFQKAAVEAISAAKSIRNVNEKKMFAFDDYPSIKFRMEKLMNTFVRDMRLTILTGIQREWGYANAYNDKYLVDAVLERFQETRDNVARLKAEQPESQAAIKELVEKYRDRNLAALETFQTRKVNGMDLSKRVWALSEQFREELEMSIDVGLGEEKSAQLMAMDVKQYLQYPDNLFRRVRNKRGILELSKRAKSFKPGVGVYRSSVKNAQRLTRTEITGAYRTADQIRWKSLDFVVGFEIKRSNNKVECPRCDSLKGRYPKTFKWFGWHPHCRCISTPIMASEKEMDDYFDKIREGEEADLKSGWEVKRPPKGFLDYITDNKKRLLSAKKPEYWVRDNFEGAKVTGKMLFL